MSTISKAVKNFKHGIEGVIGKFKVRRDGQDTFLSYSTPRGWRTVAWVTHEENMLLPKTATYINFVGGYNKTLIKMVNKISTVGPIITHKGVLRIGRNEWLGNKILLQVEPW